jgi:hypothetical protein
LKGHFEWFLRARQERLKCLKCAIEESGSLHDWTGDFSAGSIQAACRWFATQVEVRQRIPEEMAELRKHSLPGVKVSDQELSDRTFSLAFDLSVYFAECMRSAYAHLEWKQFLDDKLFVDYGQPVLVGLGRVPLNPFRIVTTFAYGVAKKEQPHDRLWELHLYWAARAPDGKIPNV